MTPTEAAKLLELPDHVTPEQIEARFHELRTKLEDKIAKAPTPGLKAKYRESLDEITQAFETLALAADSSALPVLKKEAGDRRPEAGGPASLRAGNGAAAISPRGSESGLQSPVSGLPPTKRAKSGGREFAIVAVIAVAVLGAGGWWVVKTRAEKAEQARIAAEAKAEAERKTAEERRLAEEKRRAEEEEKVSLAAAAKAEQERLDKVLAQTSASLANLRIAWEASEQEARRVERRLGELRSDERSLASAARGGTTPELLRLRAEIAAHATFFDWLETQLGRHESKILRSQAEAMVAVRQYDEAARIVALATAAQADLDREIAMQRQSLLSISGMVRVEVEPLDSDWILTDAFGFKHAGKGAGEVAGVPFGPVRLEATRQGYMPKQSEGVLRRDATLILRAGFSPSRVALTSEPAGAEIVIDGQVHGVTPGNFQWEGDGKLDVSLRLQGYEPARLTLTLPRSDPAPAHVALKRIPTGLVRPDFSRAPRKFVYREEIATTLQSRSSNMNHRQIQEELYEVEPAEGPWQRVVITTRVHRRTSDNYELLKPGTKIEYVRGERPRIIQGGYADSKIDASLLAHYGQMNIPWWTMDRPEWWPTEEKKQGESWEVSEADARRLYPHVKNGWIKLSGRVLRFSPDSIEVEFTSESRATYGTGEYVTTNDGKSTSTITIDVRGGYISAARSNVTTSSRTGDDTSLTTMVTDVRITPQQ